MNNVHPMMFHIVNGNRTTHSSYFSVLNKIHFIYEIYGHLHIYCFVLYYFVYLHTIFTQIKVVICINHIVYILHSYISDMFSMLMSQLLLSFEA